MNTYIVTYGHHLSGIVMTDQIRADNSLEACLIVEQFYDDDEVEILTIERIKEETIH